MNKITSPWFLNFYHFKKQSFIWKSTHISELFKKKKNSLPNLDLIMSSTKHQQLLSLKEENLKFKENFDKFLKKHDANKKYISKNLVSDFVQEQKF